MTAGASPSAATPKECPWARELGAAPPPGATPSFAVWAARDPVGSATPLQRIQIVKGWVEAGETREAVFDVAGHAAGRGQTSTRSPASRAEPAPMRSAACLGRSGLRSRAAAFYYARVLENPSCRWSASRLQRSLRSIARQEIGRPEALREPAAATKFPGRSRSGPGRRPSGTSPRDRHATERHALAATTGHPLRRTRRAALRREALRGRQAGAGLRRRRIRNGGDLTRERIAELRQDWLARTGDAAAGRAPWRRSSGRRSTTPCWFARRVRVASTPATPWCSAACCATCSF